MSTDTGAAPRSRPRTRIGLNARQLTAWRAFLRAHSAILRRLETDMVTAHGIPLAWYDVLVQLAEAPDRRLRMTELAERILLSRSGLTRLVDRLVSDGLVQRESDPADARGTFTVLTRAGLERLRETAPTHLRGVQEYVSNLSPEEVTTLGSLLDKLLEGEDPDETSGEPLSVG